MKMKQGMLPFSYNLTDCNGKEKEKVKNWTRSPKILIYKNFQIREEMKFS